MGQCASKNIRTAGDDKLMDFTRGNVHLVTTEEDWDRNISKAVQHGRIPLQGDRAVLLRSVGDAPVNHVPNGGCGRAHVMKKRRKGQKKKEEGRRKILHSFCLDAELVDLLRATFVNLSGLFFFQMG
ncbi:hypothetical protein MLD38_038354 [Melastoma candidum]|uniref:Uncharacterized protein n=1 Tax=Melastoma candidum TaxID=119954 RepID=A0ACB9KZU5_9MYRT|nr:hypothetical protein MLD38_038354 [Melastoma candidum]